MTANFLDSQKEDCFVILSSAEMFVRISGIRAQIFLETENIRDINIRSGSGLNDGDGKTTESDSSALNKSRWYVS